MAHQNKLGFLTLGDTEYQYRYIERDWEVMGNSALENAVFTALNGTVHSIELFDMNLKVEFPSDRKTWIFPGISCGKSFEDCVSNLRKYYRLYEIAQDCGTLKQARDKWYDDMQNK